MVKRAARPRAWLMAGFLAGLATSTHYYAIFIAFPMIGVALVRLAPVGPVGPGRPPAALLVARSSHRFPDLYAVPAFRSSEGIVRHRHVREVDIDRAVVGGMFTAVGATSTSCFATRSVGRCGLQQSSALSGLSSQTGAEACSSSVSCTLLPLHRQHGSDEPLPQRRPALGRVERWFAVVRHRQRSPDRRGTLSRSLSSRWP